MDCDKFEKLYIQCVKEFSRDRCTFLLDAWLKCNLLWT